MNIKSTFIILLLIQCNQLFSQNIVKGIVEDENSKPIAQAIVYVDGSTIKSNTNNQGEFTLDLPNGQYNLIVRADLFENFILGINSLDNKYYTIKLEPEVINLQETTVQVISKADWLYYYNTFLKLFLGSDKASQQTKIINSKDLRFRYDKQSKVLTATSKNPLIISNDYLGYDIEYDLIDFNVNYQTNYALTLGTALFTEKKTKSSPSKKWIKNREKAYLGSINHFIKSIYDNQLEENGYEVKRLIRKENPEYEKFKNEIALSKKIDGKVPPKIISYLINQKVPYDSLKIINGKNQFLNFKGFYAIEYKKEKQDTEYLKQNNLLFAGNQFSIISLNDEKLLKIEENGSYYHPINLIVEGYFSWEKIANLLPVNYKLE